MIKSTVGQILVNDALPQALRDYNRVYDQKGLDQVLSDLAHHYPDKYREVSKKLADLGSEIAFREGGLTFDLAHLARPDAAAALAKQIEQKALSIYSNDQLTPAAKKKAVIAMLQEHQPKMTDASYGEALKQNNPLALMASLGFRGNKGSIAGMLGADVMYSDYKGEPIPFPITKSFSQGLSPLQFLASTYGARQGLAATKLSTAEAGALNKQLTQAAHQVMVSRDDDEGDWHVSEDRGLPVAVDDRANIGALLARKTGEFPKNTVLTPKVLRLLQQQGHEHLLIRSPLVGGTADGGVHARDAGVRNSSRLPTAGAFLGIEAGQGAGEPLSQLQLCLAAGTMVRMADWSIKAIEEIAVNDWVMGADTDGNVFPVRVVNIYDNGVRECVSTLFSVGGTKERIELISTPEHKMLGVSRRWGLKGSKYTRGVQPVDTSCLSFAGQMPATVSNPSGKSEPFALLLGLLLGDGCYTASVHSVNFSCYDPSLIEDTKDYLAGLGLKASKCKGHKGYYRIAQVKDSPRLRDEVTGRMVPMGGAVNPIKKELTCRKMIGKYAHEKCFPDDVWSWDQKSVAAMIGGYFATDGCVYGITSNGESYDNLGVSFASTSLTMLETLRQLLAVRFGIFATAPNKQTKNRKRPIWSISINRTDEVVKFRREVPLYGIKRLTFDKLIANWKPTKTKNWSVFFRKSQTPVGLLPTYDIEVDHPDHLFQLANGLIVSNSAKHSGGVAGAAKIGGFKLIESLANPPKNMPGGAVHAQEDGVVDRIETNPAGGHDVWVNGKKHYVPHYLTLSVGRGDRIEAGDLLSEGLPNPRSVVEHKGLGEGRRYLMQTLHKAYQENRINSPGLRRNLEAMVRGMVSHVKMNDFWGGHTPDDIVNYNHIESNWSPRPGFVTKSPRSAIGKYLEVPVLHHTIGTKIRPSMLPELERFGVSNVAVHDTPPPFTPHLLRATENLQHDENWQVRLGGQYLQRGLLDAAHRGLSSSTAGNSFIPAMIQGQDIAKSLNKQPAVK